MPGLLAFEVWSARGDGGRPGVSPGLWLWGCGAHRAGVGGVGGMGLSLVALEPTAWSQFSPEKASAERRSALSPVR